MKKLFLNLLMVFLISSCDTVHNHMQSKLQSTRTYQLLHGNTNSENVTPGVPHYNAYGQPYKYVPQDNSQASPLGPIKHDAYGPGVHMDATGRAFKAVPWP